MHPGVEETPKIDELGLAAEGHRKGYDPIGVKCKTRRHALREVMERGRDDLGCGSLKQDSQVASGAVVRTKLLVLDRVGPESRGVEEHRPPLTTDMANANMEYMSASERDEYIIAQGRRYRFGKMMGEDGKARYCIDYEDAEDETPEGVMSDRDSWLQEKMERPAAVRLST